MSRVWVDRDDLRAVYDGVVRDMSVGGDVLLRLRAALDVADDDTEPDEDFATKLAHLLNYDSREGESDTPDFILAEFLETVLCAYEDALRQRANYSVPTASPLAAAPAPPPTKPDAQVTFACGVCHHARWQTGRPASTLPCSNCHAKGNWYRTDAPAPPTKTTCPLCPHPTHEGRCDGPEGTYSTRDGLCGCAGPLPQQRQVTVDADDLRAITPDVHWLVPATRANREAAERLRAALRDAEQENDHADD